MNLSKSKYYLIFSVLTIIVLSSCKKNTKNPDVIIPSQYYPLKIGATYTYLVDSIYYNDFTQEIDSFQFQVKEVYKDTFTDLSGKLAYRIERYKRFKNDSIDFENLAWEGPSIWWVNKVDQNIQRVEENIRTVNLINPIKKDLSWNGNAFNSKGSWNFYYKEIEVPFLIFDNTITVVQREIPTNLIEYQYYEQRFALNVGLIYFEYTNVESQDTDNPLPVQERAEKGVVYKQVLIEYFIPE